MKINLVSGALWAFGFAALIDGISRVLMLGLGSGALVLLWRGLPEVMINYIRPRRGPTYMKIVSLVIPMLWVAASFYLTWFFIRIIGSGLVPEIANMIILIFYIGSGIVNLVLVVANGISIARS